MATGPLACVVLPRSGRRKSIPVPNMSVPVIVRAARSWSDRLLLSLNVERSCMSLAPLLRGWMWWAATYSTHAAKSVFAYTEEGDGEYFGGSMRNCKSWRTLGHYHGYRSVYAVIGGRYGNLWEVDTSALIVRRNMKAHSRRGTRRA